MSSSTTINYREMFPKTDLTPILDIPTFETVHQLIQEVRANAASIHSNLGGGAHGHLGLVISQSDHIPTANALLRYDKSKSELAEYFHACCGSPTKSTFLQAIKQGNFATWPGLTHDLISKHLSPSIATSKGHLTQERQGLRSTTKPSLAIDTD